MSGVETSRVLIFSILLSIGLWTHGSRTFAESARAAAAVKSAEESNDAGDTDEDGDDEDEVEVVDSADPVEQGKAISGNVTLATDYILRGLSQTDHQPALQGGFDWEHPFGFYLGVWGSNVHFQDLPASLELDGYGGYTYHFTEKKSVSLGALYYSYWADGDRNNWMIPLKSQWNGFTVEVDYLPRWEGQNTQAWYFQGGWQDEVIWDVKLGGFIGYSAFSGTEAPNYADFLISASREFFGVEWQLSGIFINPAVINNTEGGDRAIFSVSKSY